MRQRTLARPTRSARSVSLHSGDIVALRLLPAAPGSGIRFCRTDLAGSDPIACRPEAVTDTLLATTLSDGNGTVAGTVEHLLSAMWACGVDNADVELDGPEVPIMDGSAVPFVMLIDDAGTVEQDADRLVWEIRQTVEIAGGDDPDRWARIEPHAGQSFDVAVDYAHPLIRSGSQRLQFEAGRDSYSSAIAPARTFGFIDEIDWLRSKRRALGGSLDNALVFDQERVCNSEGMRMPDECVRHKLLDAIGDCYVGGLRFCGRYVASKPGHALNNRLMRALHEASPEVAERVPARA